MKTWNPEQIEAWIASRYGPPETAEAKGVYMAVVGLYEGGRAIGLGSSRAAAVVDLYLDLRIIPDGHSTPPPATPWERHRRESRRRENLREVRPV